MTEKAKLAGGRGRAMAALTAAGALIAVIGGAVALLFKLEPSFEPCVGGADAAFTGAPVFPHVRHRDFLFYSRGLSQQQVREASNELGAEVRFSYREDNLRGAHLPLYYSLVTVGADGTIDGVVQGEDENLAYTVTPDGCSETGGKDLFIPTPRTSQRYRVVLELYRDQSRANRLALLETPIFRS